MKFSGTHSQGWLTSLYLVANALSSDRQKYYRPTLYKSLGQAVKNLLS